MSDETGREARSLLERAGVEANSGGTAALELLIKANFAAVNSFLRVRFGDVFTEDERRGLFLDVLYHYVRHPATYDTNRPLKTLLCAAAHNNASRESLRRRACAAELTDPSAVSERVGRTDRELGRVDDRDVLQAIARVLDDVDRKVLFAPKEEPDWASQLGRELGMTRYAVAKRWERIRRRTRATFSESGGSRC